MTKFKDCIEANADIRCNVCDGVLDVSRIRACWLPYVAKRIVDRNDGVVCISSILYEYMYWSARYAKQAIISTVRYNFPEHYDALQKSLLLL